MEVIEPDPSNQKCCICQGDCQSHFCSSCGKLCHPWCGKSIEEEEGYGGSVICTNCEEAKIVKNSVSGQSGNFFKKAGGKRARTTSKDDESTSCSSAGKRKTLQTTISFLSAGKGEQGPKLCKSKPCPGVAKRVVGAEKKSERQSFCLLCARDVEEKGVPISKGKEIYLLCRSDKNTKNRHVERNHKEIPIERNNGHYEFIVSIDDKEAKQLMLTIAKFGECLSTSTMSQDSCRMAGVKSKPQMSLSQEKGHENEQASRPLLQSKLSAGSQATLSVELPEGSSSQDALNPLEKITKKIDSLTTSMNKISDYVKGKSGINELGPLASLGTKNFKESLKVVQEWSNVENISQLINRFPNLSFFVGNSDEQLSVLRCDICYRYLTREPYANQQRLNEVLVTARKGIGRYSNSIGSGLIITPENREKLLGGHNAYWFNMKRQIKNHMLCSGELSQIHFEALKFKDQMDRRKERAIKATENIVLVALNLIETKTAAQHYETSIACHIATGSDMGDMSHGRKQMNDILKAAEIYVDRSVAKYLKEPLPSTHLPPHFYVSCDKSTVHRITNQAIMLCPLVEGRRRAIPVSASKVYSVTEENKDVINEVSGACAPELANSVYDSIKSTYGLEENALSSSWQGTCCDGQYYLAKAFQETLNQLLKHRSQFYDVIWDPPHWLDKCIDDVFKGAVGQSKEFMTRLIKRSASFHHIFNRGKLFAQATAQAECDKNKLYVTSRACATRFCTSQYHEFLKLYDSLPSYIQTFRNFAYSEITEYEIAGQDFVVDLCGAIDILSPYMTLLVNLQSLQAPIWKICAWETKLMKEVEAMEKFTLRNLPTSMEKLSANLKDVENNLFKKTKLVEGWLIVDSGSGPKESQLLTWEARQLEDCEKDLKALLKDLKSSFKSRFLECTSPMQKDLTSLDLDNIVSLLVGSRSTNGIAQIDESALESYKTKEFQSVFKFICSLNHVQRLASKEDVSFVPVLSSMVHRKLKTTLKELLWNPKYIDVLGKFARVVENKNGVLKLGPFLCNYFDHADKVNKGHLNSITSKVGFLKNLALSSTTVHFSNVYEANFEFLSICFIIDEEELVAEMFSNPTVYNMLGTEICICYDICMAKGGTEAIVESFYSSMQAQAMDGRQDKETLALRTKLEWTVPPLIQAEKLVNGTAKIYIEGDKEHKLKSHQWPTIGDGRSSKTYKVSKVVDRLSSSEAYLPFLL